MAKKVKFEKSAMAEVVKNYVHFSGENIANIFQRLEEPNRLTYHEDIWTLSHPENYDGSAGYVLREDSLKKGFVPLSKEHKTLNLIDGKRKILAPLTSSVYHFLAEDVAEIVRIINSEEYSDLELIIDISGVADFMSNRPDYDMYYLFLQTLKDKKIKHRIANFSEFQAIYIDNFFGIGNGYSEFSRFSDIRSHFSDYLYNKDDKPTRKVFLSRRKVPEPEFHPYISPETGQEELIIPTRIDDQQRLEDVFKDAGFEIIYPEDFATFRDQINYFYSVKTIASLTSSGLTNSIFMQPGGTVVEVVSPLTARPIANGRPGYLNKEFHNYYKNIAASVGHLYIGLPNGFGKMSMLDEFFETNHSALSIIKGL